MAPTLPFLNTDELEVCETSPLPRVSLEGHRKSGWGEGVQKNARGLNSWWVSLWDCRTISAEKWSRLRLRHIYLLSLTSSCTHKAEANAG